MAKYEVVTELTRREYERAQRLVDAGYFLNVSDFVRSAVRDKLNATKPTLAHKASPKAVQNEVYSYIKSHPNVYPDEIADALNLNIETVMDTVTTLMSKKKIREST